MHSGRYVFSLVVDFVPRYEFDRIVAKYNGNYHARGLSCYNQFLHLLLGQLTGCSTLRETCLCLEAHRGILYHLRFRNTVDSTSLSWANERRDYMTSSNGLSRTSSSRRCGAIPKTQSRLTSGCPSAPI